MSRRNVNVTLVQGGAVFWHLVAHALIRRFAQAARTLVLVLGAFTAALAQPATPSAPPALVELDVPFVVSPTAVTTAMLEMAKVGANDFVIDLGAGDGRIVILAASKFGARGLGVEIDPALVALARTNAEKAKVASRVEFRVQDLFATDLGTASVITMYLLPDVNLALRPKLLRLTPGTRILSHDWDMGDWAADETQVVDHPEKSVGLEKVSRVHLWIVPANIDGKWCATDVGSTSARPQSVMLDISQRYQKIAGRLSSADRNTRPLDVQFRATMHGNQFAIPHSSSDAAARVDGETIFLDGHAYGQASTLAFRRLPQGVATCGQALKPIATSATNATSAAIAAIALNP
jgi:SAM-dependent methyltransferase